MFNTYVTTFQILQLIVPGHKSDMQGNPEAQKQTHLKYEDGPSY